MTIPRPWDLTSFFEAGMSRDLPVFELGKEKETGPFISLARLNLGPGHKQIEGTRSLDLPEWDADKDAIPFPDESITDIFAFHFLEHCADPIEVLRECQRALTIGGVLNIVVPYYSSNLQAHDLDHKHSFSEDTWKTLFSTDYYSKGHEGWKFKIGLNMIMGIVERNLCLFTQLIKEQ